MKIIKTESRVLKNKKKSFREYNIRRRGLNQPEVSWDDYLLLHKKIPVNHKGIINPQILEGQKNMEKTFGDRIYTERNTCIKCGSTKPLVDFICRHKTKRIENICKACERRRHRK